jgi:uncharacterized membrane protein YeaQ/YmgE (transglycosylase-associated protein family)
MAQNNQGGLRDAIWQFIGTLIAFLALMFAIFAWFVPNRDALFTNHSTTNSAPASTVIVSTPIPTTATNSTPASTVIVSTPIPTTTNSRSSNHTSTYGNTNVYDISFLDVFFYFITALIVGSLGEFIVGWRLPFGIVVAIFVGAVGAWLSTRVIPLSLPDLTLAGYPIIRGFFGAFILVVLWHLLTSPFYRRRRRYYRQA